MLRTRILCWSLALCCAIGLIGPVSAAQVDCDSQYCFTPEDFSQEKLAGICILELPRSSQGTVMLGTRVLRPGDILSADQVAQMTFHPQRTETDDAAQVTYLPIYSDRVAEETTLSISIRGKEDNPPVAEDFAAETYKNLPLEGKLKVKDPEGQTMTFAITRQGKRGTVSIADDGTFTYTPKKNKVGVDSFAYTATDASGKVSREATVTITILKPTDAPQYTDTVGHSCRFAAEWMKNTGIFVGESVAENPVFSPDREVSRGEFVTMLVRALEIPVQQTAEYTGYAGEIPAWLQPYLAAAVRSGLTAGLPDGQVFDHSQTVTGAEAAVMLQNALDLTAGQQETQIEAAPAWAEDALMAMNSNGLLLQAEAPLTRGQAAQLLYQAVQLADSAPGMQVIRMQR